MPVTVSYPGVYIEEIPSGGRTIVGVPTSITAFIGRTAKGPTDLPLTVFNFGEFERQYGGLSREFPLTYAVQDFFNNGGNQAVIARIFAQADSPNNTTGLATLALTAPQAPAAPSDTVKTAPRPAAGSVASISLRAKTPGLWGNFLYAAVDQNGLLATPPGHGYSETLRPTFLPLDIDELKPFNVTIYYAEPGKPIASERFLNVSLVDKAGPYRLDRVLAQSSQWALWDYSAVDPTTIDPWLQAWAAWSTAAAKWKRTPITALLLPATGGNDGKLLQLTDYLGSQDLKTGIYLLDKADLFNLLCVPPDTIETPVDDQNIPLKFYGEAAVYCKERRAMLLMDPPKSWTTNAEQGHFGSIQLSDLGNYGDEGRNAAIYFPRITRADPLLGGHIGTFAASGAIAGIYARTDTARGVWKAPAGLEAGVSAIQGLEFKLTDAQNGLLNPVGINCLRSFPVTGTVVWGARTLKGADQLSDDYKYVPVRRLTLYIEESLYRGTQWAVFEPNNETLWSQLRLSIGAFMGDLSRQGAFYSYNVKCDKDTTTQYDIDRGMVNVQVAFAPVKPAEFVILQIQQLAGQKPA